MKKKANRKFNALCRDIVSPSSSSFLTAIATWATAVRNIVRNLLGVSFKFPKNCTVCSIVCVTALSFSTLVNSEEIASAYSPRLVKDKFNLTKELSSEKRVKAKDGNLVWTLALTPKFGYASNVFSSPEEALGDTGLEHESTYHGIAGRISLIRYFDNIRLGLSGQAQELLYDDADNLNSRRQRINFWSDITVSPETKVSMNLRYQRKDDDVVDIFGGKTITNELQDELDDSFESETYSGAMGFTHDLNDRHRVGIFVDAKIRDVNDKNRDLSLDWLKYGPKLKYRYRISETQVIRFWYDFLVQQYDESLASTRTGTKLAENPEKKHYSHKVLIWYSRDLTDNFRLNLKYKSKIKDDRFQEFESYIENGVAGGFSFHPTPASRLDGEVYYKRRDYDNRPGETANQTLDSDKWGLSLGYNYAITKNLVLTCQYDYDNRDTNLETGKSFREYENHEITTSLTYAF